MAFTRLNGPQPFDCGYVTAVRGPVIEAVFAENNLPGVYEALKVRLDGHSVFLEVSHHLSPIGIGQSFLATPKDWREAW